MKFVFCVKIFLFLMFGILILNCEVVRCVILNITLMLLSFFVFVVLLLRLLLLPTVLNISLLCVIVWLLLGRLMLFCFKVFLLGFFRMSSAIFQNPIPFDTWLYGFHCYDEYLSERGSYTRRIFMAFWFACADYSDVCSRCFGCNSGFDSVIFDYPFKDVPQECVVIPSV